MAQQNGLLYASVTITLKVGADNIRETQQLGRQWGNFCGASVRISMAFLKLKAWPDVAEGFGRHGWTYRESETQVATLQFSTAWSTRQPFAGGGNL